MHTYINEHGIFTKTKLSLLILQISRTSTNNSTFMRIEAITIKILEFLQNKLIIQVINMKKLFLGMNKEHGTIVGCILSFNST